MSKLYGMLPAETAGDPSKRTPADNQTVRNVFVVGPDKKTKLILVYPMTTGRNFDEVLRVIDSLQLTAKHKVATPVNWQQGKAVIIAGLVSDDEARLTFGRLEGATPVHPDRAAAAVTVDGVANLVDLPIREGEELGAFGTPIGDGDLDVSHADVQEAGDGQRIARRLQLQVGLFVGPPPPVHDDPAR